MLRLLKKLVVFCTIVEISLAKVDLGLSFVANLRVSFYTVISSEP